ncbi:hypothetical protein MTR67_036067, partial [Solanum verrucosum]
MSILKWKWERIAMDFVVGLPKTVGKFDSIWVVVDRLTKSAYFISIKLNYNAEQLAKVYVKEIVRLHGVPLSIISDRDPFDILKCVGPVAYRLALPPNLSSVHPIFHVS